MKVLMASLLPWPGLFIYFGWGKGKEGNASCTVAPKGAVCGAPARPVSGEVKENMPSDLPTKTPLWSVFSFVILRRFDEKGHPCSISWRHPTNNVIGNFSHQIHPLLARIFQDGAARTVYVIKAIENSSKGECEPRVQIISPLERSRGWLTFMAL